MQRRNDTISNRTAVRIFDITSIIPEDGMIDLTKILEIPRNAVNVPEMVVRFQSAIAVDYQTEEFIDAYQELLYSAIRQIRRQYAKKPDWSKPDWIAELSWSYANWSLKLYVTIYKGIIIRERI